MSGLTTTPGASAGLGDLTASPAVLIGLVAEVGEPTPAPTQAPTGGFEAWEVSPGLIGFVPVFLIALACVGLFLSLTKHMRRVAVRQAQRDAEEAGPADPRGDARPQDGRSGPADASGDARPQDGRSGPR